MNKKLNCGKYTVELIIPREIELFIKAAHIDTKEIFNNNFWGVQADDEVFFSHTKHPTEEGYESHMDEPLSKSKKLKVLVHGFYLHSKQLFELEPQNFIKEKPLITSSVNIEGGWRMYFSFYEA